MRDPSELSRQTAQEILLQLQQEKLIVLKQPTEACRKLGNLLDFIAIDTMSGTIEGLRQNGQLKDKRV